MSGLYRLSLATLCLCTPARQAGQGHPSGQPDKAIVSAHSSILIDITANLRWRSDLEISAGTPERNSSHGAEEALKTDKGHGLSDPSIKPAGSVQGCTGKPKAYSPDVCISQPAQSPAKQTIRRARSAFDRRHEDEIAVASMGAEGKIDPRLRVVARFPLAGNSERNRKRQP